MRSNPAKSILVWSARILFACSILVLGGCGWSDLARQDREVRASWSALLAADQMNLALAERLAKSWQGAPGSAGDGIDEAVAAMRRMTELQPVGPAENDRVAEYANARARLIAHIKGIAETLSRPASANLAWRLRGLRKECVAAVLRADAAARAYNEAARGYNQALGSRTGKVSMALLFPGLHEFALLEIEQDVQIAPNME